MTHEIVYPNVTSGRGWRLDKDYMICWVKLRFTVNSIETPPTGNRGVELDLIAVLVNRLVCF